MKLSTMNISDRTHKLLNRLGFITAGDVVDAAMADYDLHDNHFSVMDGLMKIDGIGPRTAREVVYAIKWAARRPGVSDTVEAANTVEVSPDCCDSCRWYDNGLGYPGQCRRFPPSFIGIHSDMIDDDVNWRFPTTDKDSCCGEYEYVDALNKGVQK